jgi:flagellar L-ring protein precursor FlgH
MILRAVLIAAAALLGVAALAPGQSLWSEGAPGGSLFADHRARRVNDIVTILIVEESSSARSANTTTSKDTSRTATIKRFPTYFDPVAKKLVKPIADTALGGYEPPSEFMENRFNLDLQGKASHQGKGSIERADKVKGQIAARVVKVLDNGNLVIEGRRAVLVNNDTHVITISGIVRPQDITGSNTVLSSQIADAEVQMVGRGVLAEAQRPGILFRILDWLQLF